MTNPHRQAVVEAAIAHAAYGPQISVLLESLLEGSLDTLLDSLGSGALDNLLDALQVGGGVYDVTFTVGDPHTSLVNVAIQALDAQGDDLAVPAALDLYLFADTGAAAINAIDLDSVAIGADGVLITQVANQHYIGITEADGDIDIDFTEATATGNLYVAWKRPNGTLKFSDVVTFTA